MMTSSDRHTDSKGIVPAGTPADQHRYRWLWFAGIALSVVVMAWHSMLGAVCLAMGIRTQAERFGGRGLGAGLVIVMLVLAGWTMTSGIDTTLFAVPLVFVSIAIAASMWKRRASVFVVSLIVAIASASSMAIDSYVAAQQGMSLAEATCSLLMSIMQASVGTGIEAQLTLSAVEPIFETIWPIIYVTSALLDVALAGAGSAFAAARPVGTQLLAPSAQHDRRSFQLARFDAPLWAVGLLAASVLGIGVSFADIPEVQMVRTISVTLLLSVRYIFMLQGFGVALGLMERARFGCFARAVVIMVAAWLETMFFLSIVGLVDVWANFRQLPRNGQPQEASE